MSLGVPCGISEIPSLDLFKGDNIASFRPKFYFTSFSKKTFWHSFPSQNPVYSSYLFCFLCNSTYVAFLSFASHLCLSNTTVRIMASWWSWVIYLVIWWIYKEKAIKLWSQIQKENENERKNIRRKGKWEKEGMSGNDIYIYIYG